MARPPRNTEAAREMADRLARLNASVGARPKQVERFAYKELDIEISDESVRKALVGEVDPQRCDIELLVALARFFAVDYEGLGPVAARRFQLVSVVMGSGPDDEGEQETATSRCNVLRFDRRAA